MVEGAMVSTTLCLQLLIASCKLAISMNYVITFVDQFT